MRLKVEIWGSRAATGLAALFLFFDALGKFVQPAPVLAATEQLGFPATALTLLGAVLAISTLIYLIPRTAVLGAILLTGYLGGAVAIHLRAGGPVFSLLFPVAMGSLVWCGLWLRDGRLRSLVPLRS